MENLKHRTILRSVAAPQTPFPHQWRMSSLARWYWCAEQSRHKVLGLVPPHAPTLATTDGTELHDDILTKVLGQRYPWEDEFMEILAEVQDPTYGFMRRFGTDTIYDDITGHPDDFQITPDGTVYIVEHKTTAIKPDNKGFMERYYLPMAEFQVKGYAWMFEEVIKHPKFRANYRIGKTHEVLFWYVDHKAQTCELLGEYPFQYYRNEVETNLTYQLTAYKHPEMIIPPKCTTSEKPWKCRQCSRESKAVCRFNIEREEKLKNESKSKT